MKILQSISPLDGQVFDTFPMDTPTAIDNKIDAAVATQKNWRKTSISDRVDLLLKIASQLDAHKEKYARQITREMGKVIHESIGEIEKCAWLCRYYAEEGPAFLEEQIVETDFRKSKVSFQPLGVVLAVMPWNFPFWQVFRAAIPAVLAGNAMLLKHASNVMGCAQAIGQIFDEAGAPKGLFTPLFIYSGLVKQVIEHPAVQSVSLTGSDRAGASVARIAGNHLVKTVLELGGNDPYIVLEDADLEDAAAIITQSRLYNGGQSCISAKRMIVVESVYEDFLALFTEKMSAATYGNPMEADMVYGPMARHDLRDGLYEQQTRSIAGGAELHIGGFIPDSEGAFYPPTILTNVRPGQTAFDEELFGPIAAVTRAKDEREAVRLANLSKYGLGAAVFSRDLKRAERLATEEIEAGNVTVNALVRSDPRLPFGGVKRSGYGRELSHFGLREFVNVKTISIA